MNPTPVTDFVTKACDNACQRHQAAVQLHQAGHDFGAAISGGWIFILAVVALAVVLFGPVVARRRAGWRSGRI